MIGPGLNRAFEITDQAFLDSWNSLLGLEVGVDYAQEMKPLSQTPRVDIGYDLARYMRDPDGRSYVWDRLRNYTERPRDRPWSHELYFARVDGWNVPKSQCLPLQGAVSEPAARP